MKTTERAGRAVGVLLFVQLVLITAGFILLAPITAPSFLQDAAGMSVQIRTAVLLLTACGLITIGIAATGFSVFRQNDPGMALALLALSAIWFSMQAIDNVHILSMLSLSQQHAKAGASGDDALGLVATAMRSTRKFSHCTALLAIDLWFVLFFSLLFRLSLIPRVLAAFGILMAAIHFAGVAAPPFVGYSSVGVFGYSLALSYLTIGTWLIWKGFKVRPREGG